MEGTMNGKSLYGFEMREPDLRRSSNRKTHNVKQLWQRTHEILNLGLRGLKQVEIAEILNITPQTVSNTLNSDLGRQKLSVMRKSRDEKAIEVTERIADLTDQALNVYEELFKGENVSDETKRKAADTVTLELSGYRVPTRIQSQRLSSVATLEEIEEFKRRGIEAGRASGKIVDLDENGELKEETE